MAPLVESKSWQKSDKTNKRTNPFVRAQSLDSSQQHEAAKDLAHDRNSDRFGQNLAKQATARQNQPTGNGIQIEDRTNPQQETKANSEDEAPGTISSDSADPFVSRMRKMGKTKNNGVTNGEPAQSQQEAQTKADMEAYKQRALAQIAQKKSKLEKELAELEKDLTDFKNGQAIRILGIFHPGIERLIDVIINQIRKRANKMSKKAQIKFYQTTIASLEELKIALTALKLMSAFLDAAFVDNKSCLRLVLITLATIIIPIILIIISPLYILFFGLLIYMNKFPGVKGFITKQVCKCSDKVDGWIQNFKKKINILQPEVRLQEQIAKLEQTAQQVQSGQISNRGSGGKN